MTAPVVHFWLVMPLVLPGAFASGIRPACWFGSRLPPCRGDPTRHDVAVLPPLAPDRPSATLARHRRDDQQYPAKSENRRDF